MERPAKHGRAISGAAGAGSPGPLSRGLARLLAAQRARPALFLVVAGLLTAVAGALAAGLRIDASYEALLPTEAPELRTVQEVRDRTGGLRHLVVAVTGDEPGPRRAFAAKLAAELGQLDAVRHVDLEFPVDFLKARSLWLWEIDELRELADAADLAAERAAAGYGDTAARALGLRIGGLIETQRSRIPFEQRLESRDGRTTFIWVVLSADPNRIRAGRALLARIDEVTARLEPERQGITVHPAGMLVLYREQHQLLSADLRRASTLALVLCVLLVAAGVRWAPAPLTVAAALLPGVAWTFGALSLWSDTINMVTGFLIPVLLGLGVDFSLHLLTRFRQELRSSDARVPEALERAVHETFRPIAASAMTTAATFLCFAVARFPGFREFGLVAGIGVVLTFASTMMILPPLLLVLPERLHGRSRRGPVLPAPVARLGLRHLAPVPVALLVVLAAVGVVEGWRIPYLNDYRHLHGSLPEAEFNDWVNENLGFGTNPTVIVAGSLDDARRIATLARAQKRRGQPAGQGVAIAQVVAVTDMLPSHLDERRALIARLRTAARGEALSRAARDDERLSAGLRRAEDLLDAEPPTFETLPEVLRRRFVTLDGQGFLVYLFPTRRIESDRLAFAWIRQTSELAEAIRREGMTAQIADEVFIHGWVSQLVADDVPRLIPVAVAVVLLILLVDLRRPGRVLLLAVPLFVGVAAYLGSAAALGLHFNMFNILAIPTIFGIGIDATLHMYHRLRREGSGSYALVLRSTGLAVILASATSAAGFGSSLVCHHRGLESLGVMAILGITTTTLSALFLLPSLLAARERRR